MINFHFVLYEARFSRSEEISCKQIFSNDAMHFGRMENVQEFMKFISQMTQNMAMSFLNTCTVIIGTQNARAKMWKIFLWVSDKIDCLEAIRCMVMYKIFNRIFSLVCLCLEIYWKHELWLCMITISKSWYSWIISILIQFFSEKGW